MLAACLLLVTEWHCCHCIFILYSEIDVSDFPLVCCTEILVWSSHYVRIMLRVIVRNFLGDCIWLWTFDWWRRFQCDIWLSTAWPYIWKVLKFSLSLPAIGCCAFFCWRRFQCDTWLSTAWPYIWKVLTFSFKFAGHWLLCFFLLKTISGRSLVIDCLALYLKGTEIFLFVKDDFSSIHCYRLLGLIFERYWNFLLSLPAIGCCAFFCWRRFQFDHWLSTAWPYIWKVLRFSYCWRRFQCDTWLSTAWPYIWKVLKFSYFGLKTVTSFYLDSHCWPMLSEYTIFFPILLNSVPVQFGYRLLVLRWLLWHIICR